MSTIKSGAVSSTTTAIEAATLEHSYRLQYAPAERMLAVVVEVK